MDSTIAFKGEDRPIDLGFKRDFHIHIPSNRGQTGEAITFIVFPLGQLGMPGRINCTLKEFDLAFPAGCASPAGGIDMNSRLHGGLKEVLLLIHRNFSFTGMKSYSMLRHE